MFKREGEVTREAREWIISILRLGLKDLKHDDEGHPVNTQGHCRGT